MAISVALLLFPFAPQAINAGIAAALGTAPGMLYQAPYIGFTATAAVGLFAFFLVTVIAAAVLEHFNIAAMAGRNGELLGQQTRGERVYPHDFLATAEADSIKAAAEHYAGGLHREAAAEHHIAQPARLLADAPAATVFMTRGFIEGPLFLDLLRPLPSIFFGLSAFGLLSGLIDGLARNRSIADSASGAGGEGFASGFEVGLVAAVLPLLLGVACWFLTEAVINRRSRQIALLCRVLDGLFPPISLAYVMQRLSAGITGSGGAETERLGDLVPALGAELTRQFARLEMALEAHENARNATLRQALEGRSGNGISADKLGKLLQAMSQHFAVELKTMLGDDLSRFQATLKAAAARLESTTKGLASGAEALAQHSTGAGASAITELARSVQSLQPILHGLESAQTHLLEGLAAQQSANQAVLAAISEAPPAPRINDVPSEAVPAKTPGEQGAGSEPEVTPEQRSRPPDAAPERAASDIMRALEELRAESEEAARTLPKI